MIIGPLASLRPGMLTEPRVVKPVHGRDSIGVTTLIPRSGGGWDDILRKRVFRTFEELIDYLHAPLGKRTIRRDRWIVEELLLPPDGAHRPVDDIKLYTFRGAVACTLVISKHGERKRYRWFDDNWQPIDVGKHSDNIDPAIEPPSSASEITELARRLSERLPLPFVRVDCYDTQRGPVVGELTPLPGSSDRFSSEWDEKLGTMYEDSESALLRSVCRWRRSFGLQPWLAVRDRARQIRTSTDVAATVRGHR